jgi:serine/threonine protein kinase
MEAKTMLLGNYKVSATLGAGAFAVVYKATDIDSGREVALKVGKPEGVTTHEVNVMEALQGSPGFPRIYETRMINRHRIIAMQLLGHSTSEQFRAANKSFSAKTTIDIFTSGVDRLEAMHRAGYIHRDIKPQHLIYSSTSKTLYLTDFGLSNSPSYSSTLLNGSKSVRLAGNPRFAGINAHMTPNHSSADDLESMVYLAMYFINGFLPWDYLFDKKGDQWMSIRDFKQNYLASGCPMCPPVIKELLSYLRSLRNTSYPDYNFLRQKIQALKALDLDYTEVMPHESSMNLMPAEKKQKRVNKSSQHIRKIKNSPQLPTCEDAAITQELNLNCASSPMKGNRTKTIKVDGPVMTDCLRKMVLGEVAAEEEGVWAVAVQESTALEELQSDGSVKAKEDKCLLY